MDESQTREIFEIVGEIEAAWVNPADAEFPQLVGVLTERQRHLARLQDFDVSKLSPSLRNRLHARVARILERDQELRVRVETIRESLVKQAAELRRSRRGAEGYRRVAREPRPAFDRMA